MDCSLKKGMNTSNQWTQCQDMCTFYIENNPVICMNYWEKNSRNNIKEDPSVRYWYLICMFRYNSEGILIFRLFFHIHVEQYRLWTLSILYLTFRLLDGSENNKLHVCYKYRIWKLPPGLASTEKNILNRLHSDTNWNWEYTTRLHFSEVASTEKKYLSWRHQNWRRRSNSLL